MKTIDVYQLVQQSDNPESITPDDIMMLQASVDLVFALIKEHYQKNHHEHSIELLLKEVD